jgi:broad specificity phosphatase PhoE
MRILEVRRHTMRRKPGPHLSQAGIDLARLVGADSGPYDRVVTSTLPRAVETAVAMGFAVNQTVEELGQLPGEVDAAVGWPSRFERVAAVVRGGGPAARFAAAHAALWSSILAEVPDGGRVLVISHGLLVELGAVGSVPDADHAAWGEPIGYCEGIRLSVDGDRRRGQILRVPEAHRLVEN